MTKRVCDICGKEISAYRDSDFGDSKTQFYSLLRREGGFERYEIDICNDCLHKVMQLAGEE